MARLTDVTTLMPVTSPPPTSADIPAPPSRPPFIGRTLRDSLSGKRRGAIETRLFLVPMVVVFIVLFAMPLVRSVWWSFTDFNGYNSDAAFVGLRNYANIFTDPSMLAGLSFTVAFSLATTVVITIFAIPLAMVLNQKFFGRDFVRSVFFFPAIPSVAILGLVWGFILNPLGSGALNSVLAALGAGGAVPWLSNGTLAQVSVVAVAVWTSTGWHAILYLAYLQSIPTDFYEVAKIDGAGVFQRAWYITIPLLAPAMSVSWLLLLTGGLKVYDLPFTLTKGGPGYSTFTITQTIIQNGVSQAKYGQASALAVLFMIAVGAIVATQLVVSSRWARRVS